MAVAEVDAVLLEWVTAIDDGIDPDLRAVANALFLEETFGITLSDAEIDGAVIGTLAGMRAVLDEHLRGRGGAR